MKEMKCLKAHLLEAAYEDMVSVGEILDSRNCNPIIE